MVIPPESVSGCEPHPARLVGFIGQREARETPRFMGRWSIGEWLPGRSISDSQRIYLGLESHKIGARKGLRRQSNEVAESLEIGYK